MDSHHGERIQSRLYSHDAMTVLRAASRKGAKAIAEAVIPKSLVVFRGPRTRPRGVAANGSRVALTFDDGPADLTPSYLEVLDRFGAKATFFLVGELCASRRELVSAIAERGHQLAGHGFSHRRFPKLSNLELRDELDRTERLLPPNDSSRVLVRPPHGAVSVASILTCAQAGFTTALWSFDSRDSSTQHAREVVEAFDEEASSEQGAVVLLHEGQPWTLEALPEVLNKLKEAGRELVTMGELLDG